ncbi:MAG TPA: DUF2490 domain-containing protein, partial [Chitinophagaceae bacterium]|nr:DUF2490 domain-containing protein [Chitinophagaceae bacterium]
MRPALPLLLSSVATLHSSFSSPLSKSAAVHRERSVGSHSHASGSSFSKTGKLSFFLLISFLLTQNLFSQTKQTESLQQVWLAYNNQTRFSDKWGAWADIHLRTKEDFFSHLSSSITRFGLTHYLNDDTKLTLGYAYITHFPQDNHGNINRPEHRPWQQLQWHNKY